MVRGGEGEELPGVVSEIVGSVRVRARLPGICWSH